MNKNLSGDAATWDPVSLANEAEEFESSCDCGDSAVQQSLAGAAQWCCSHYRECEIAQDDGGFDLVASLPSREDETLVADAGDLVQVFDCA
jgi:hypothetical protein